jgi:hypothetical protein
MSVMIWRANTALPAPIMVTFGMNSLRCANDVGHHQGLRS